MKADGLQPEKDSLLEGRKTQVRQLGEQLSMKKSKSTRRQSASKSKNFASKSVSAVKKGGGSKSKSASTRTKADVSVQRGAGATAPVVYQTLRERVAAVNANVGETRTLSDFLKSSGWS